MRWQGGGVTILQGDFFAHRYAGHLRRRLEPGGVLLLVTIEYDAARRSGPPFPVFSDEVRQLFAGIVERSRQALRQARWNGVGGADAVVWVMRTRRG